MGYNNDNYNQFSYKSEDIRIESKVISVRHFVDLTQKGDVNLFPDFYRQSFWKEEQKSLLIESMLLRIPLPSFYFYEDNDWKLNVIDGVQRLTTIYEFFENKYSLKRLPLLHWCESMYFNDLSLELKYRILRTQLQVNIIDARTPKDILFEVFRRLNTGCSMLTNQELRNSVAKPHVRLFLTKLASYDLFRFIVGPQKNDRLQSQESVLKFVAFYRSYDPYLKQLNHYHSKNLREFLDFHFYEINDSPEYDLHKYEKAFTQALDNIKVLIFDNNFLDRFDNQKRNFIISLLVVLSNYSRFEIFELNQETFASMLQEQLTNNYMEVIKNSGLRNFEIKFKFIQSIIDEVKYIVK